MGIRCGQRVRASRGTSPAGGRRPGRGRAGRPRRGSLRSLAGSGSRRAISPSSTSAVTVSAPERDRMAEAGIRQRSPTAVAAPVGVAEHQRHDADGDEVAPVDPREAAGRDRLHSQVQRGERGLLAGGALAVVVPADDPGPPRPRARASWNSGSRRRNMIVGARLDVRPHRHADRAVRGHVAGGDVVRRRRSAPARRSRPAVAPAAGGGTRFVARARSRPLRRGARRAARRSAWPSVDRGSGAAARSQRGPAEARGSVIVPVSALAAAVEGEHR